MQEFSKPYSIDFSHPQKALPNKAFISFPEFNLTFTILNDDWPMLIPGLKQVNAALKLHEFQQVQIESIRYDPIRKELNLSTHEKKRQKDI